MDREERKLRKALEQMARGHEAGKELKKAAKLRRAMRDDAPRWRLGLDTVPREDYETLDLPSVEKRRRRTPRSILPTRGGAPATPDDSPGAVGMVIAVAAGSCRVRQGERELHCRLSPALQAHQQTDLAVGDEVTVRSHGATFRVDSVLPRRSRLSRPDPANPHRERVLAANVDTVVIAAALRAPGLRPGLIDRLLVAAQAAGIEALLCVNKVDLICEAGGPDPDDGELRTLDPYRQLGVPVVLCSAHTGCGLPALRARLAGKTAVLVGASGVGKSSLLNALVPAGQLRTGAVRERDGRGRHTTTGAEVHALPDGGWLIDTPGVREFGLWGLDSRAVSRAFEEFAPLHNGCRFGDCSHLDEPGCAVRAAVERGEIAVARYAAYRRILASLGPSS